MTSVMLDICFTTHIYTESIEAINKLRISQTLSLDHDHGLC